MSDHLRWLRLCHAGWTVLLFLQVIPLAWHGHVAVSHTDGVEGCFLGTPLHVVTVIVCCLRRRALQREIAEDVMATILPSASVIRALRKERTDGNH